LFIYLFILVGVLISMAIFFALPLQMNKLSRVVITLLAGLLATISILLIDYVELWMNAALIVCAMAISAFFLQKKSFLMTASTNEHSFNDDDTNQMKDKKTHIALEKKQVKQLNENVSFPLKEEEQIEEEDVIVSHLLDEEVELASPSKNGDADIKLSSLELDKLDATQDEFSDEAFHDSESNKEESEERDAVDEILEEPVIEVVDEDDSIEADDDALDDVINELVHEMSQEEENVGEEPIHLTDAHLVDTLKGLDGALQNEQPDPLEQIVGEILMKDEGILSSNKANVNDVEQNDEIFEEVDNCETSLNRDELSLEAVDGKETIALDVLPLEPMLESGQIEYLAEEDVVCFKEQETERIVDEIVDRIEVQGEAELNDDEIIVRFRAQDDEEEIVLKNELKQMSETYRQELLKQLEEIREEGSEQLYEQLVTDIISAPLHAEDFFTIATMLTEHYWNKGEDEKLMFLLAWMKHRLTQDSQLIVKVNEQIENLLKKGDE